MALLATVASCDMGDFGDINTNPNYPSEGSTGGLFVRASEYVRYFVFNNYYYDIWTQQYPGYLSESKNNQYGPLDCTTSFSIDTYYIYPIKNLNEIIERNEDDATKNETSVTSFGSNANQIAVAKTLRAFFYMSLTDIVGPIPYSEAFKGDSDDNWTPKLDSGQDVYTALDTELNEAFAMFDESGSLTDDDILYGGDITKWKKFNASLRMMMAIKMKDADAATGKSRFAKAYADGGMTSADDSFTYQYDSYSGSYANYSPMYCCAYGIGSGNQNHVPNKIIVDALKKYNDPRLFTYCDVSETAYKGKAGAYGADDQRSYRGVPFGLSSNDEVNKQSKYCCSVGSKYCDQMATYGVITAARTLLVEAEAAQLGWISASAKTLYEQGIKASFEFEASTDNSWSYDLNAYMAQSEVAFNESDSEAAMKQILTQRWLAGYLTDGVEAWADWRINNVPELPMYSGQLDNDHTTYPYRMAYDGDDMTANSEQFQKAIDTYYAGNNDRWARIWWDTKDNTSPVGELESDDEIAAYSPVTWTQIGTGTMNYILDPVDYVFGTVTGDAYEGVNKVSVSGLPIYQQNEDPTIFKIEKWGRNGDVTLQFTVADNGTITVPVTSCDSYGSYTFSCSDYATCLNYGWEYASSYMSYYSDDLAAGPSCVREGDTFKFYLSYVLDNYYAPYYMLYDPDVVETFVIDNK